MAISVLLVQDHTTTLEGWRVLLEAEDDIEICCVARDGRTAVDLVRGSPPDVVVMEAVLPELNGVEATRQILAETPRVRLVGLSVHNDRLMGKMMEAGASAYVGRADSHGSLVEAIRQVQAGNQYVSPQLIGAFGDYIRRSLSGRSSTLTPREREVLQLTAEGKKAKEIAAALAVSETTVRSQVWAVRKKLGLDSSAALTKYAVNEGITSPNP
ncbi:MAG: response regulator transcription factor [Gemmatimonadaceae bacterium]|nr:response regulator transcription factor [Gemmatimonadaceae bacterium]